MIGHYEPRNDMNDPLNAVETLLVYDLRFAIRVCGKHRV
jgi:hypothetical protein